MEARRFTGAGIADNGGDSGVAGAKACGWQGARMEHILTKTSNVLIRHDGRYCVIAFILRGPVLAGSVVLAGLVKYMYI